MADSPSEFSPWYETLKGIRRNGSRSSPSSRVSPANGDIDIDIETGSVKTEPSPDEISTSSFTFSKNAFQLPAAPPPPRSSSFSFWRSASQSKARSSPPDSLAAKAKQSSDEVSANYVPPTTEMAPSSLSQQTPLTADRPVSPLSLPPAAIQGGQSDKKSLELPVMRDFEYHPRPEDRFYSLAKYDLGPEVEVKRRRRRCICWTLTTILVILMALGIVVGVLAVKLNPKQPSHSIGDLSVTSLNYSEVNGPQLALAMSYSLTLSNPNKFAKVIYSEIAANPFFERLALGSYPLPSFVQGKKVTTHLAADFLRMVTSVPSDIEDQLKAEVQNSNVQIDLRGSVKGKYRVLMLNVKHFSIPIICTLNVKPADDGVQPTILATSCFDQP